MYLRFESPLLRDRRSHCALGLFQTLRRLDDRPDLTSCWQMTELLRLYKWFNENLGIPERFRLQRRCSAPNGICWFRATATDCISNARYMAWLLDDLGQPLEERRSKTPGRVIWQDDYQVVASTRLI